MSPLPGLLLVFCFSRGFALLRPGLIPVAPPTLVELASRREFYSEILRVTASNEWLSHKNELRGLAEKPRLSSRRRAKPEKVNTHQFSCRSSFLLPRSRFANREEASQPGILSALATRIPITPMICATVCAPSHAHVSITSSLGW